jgi:HAD superfamily hydrolase (TIGR01493 family)
MTKSSGLSFNMLLSSELLGLAKPDPAIYLKATELLKCKPEECVMVAAHADDLSAAKEAYVCCP